MLSRASSIVSAFGEPLSGYRGIRLFGRLVIITFLTNSKSNYSGNQHMPTSIIDEDHATIEGQRPLKLKNNEKPSPITLGQQSTNATTTNTSINGTNSKNDDDDDDDDDNSPFQGRFH